jgi:membrane-associated phospholipid phosphatase
MMLTKHFQAWLDQDYHALARWISWIFHPFVVVVPTMILSMYFTTRSWYTAVQWTIISFAFVIVPAILFIVRKLRRREYTDADVSVRQHRFGIYIFAGLCELLCLAVLIHFDAPRILIACFFAAILTLVVGTLATTKTKISAHAAGMGGCTTVFLYVAPAIALAFAVATLAVGWSRIYLKQHTLLQVALGWAIAVASVLTVFTIFPGVV